MWRDPGSADGIFDVMIDAVAEANDLIARNQRTLLDIRALVDPLRMSDLPRVTASGWSVSATLAHLAFWDDWVAERWRRWLEKGRFDDLPDDLTELVNAAGIRIWNLARPELVKATVVEAAEAVAIAIAELPEAALHDAIATRRLAMIDRSLHWAPHLHEIAEAMEP